MEILVTKVEEGMTISYGIRTVTVRKICVNPYFGWIGFEYGHPDVYYNFLGWFTPEQTVIRTK